MFFTHIITIVNLTAAMLSSLLMLSLSDLTALLLSLSFLPHCHHCLLCLHCHYSTDEVFNKWWHCDLTCHTCHINEGHASLMQSLISYSSVVIFEVLKHSLIIFVSSSVIHKTLKWSESCTDHLLLSWDEQCQQKKEQQQRLLLRSW